MKYPSTDDIGIDEVTVDMGIDKVAIHVYVGCLRFDKVSIYACIISWSSYLLMT